MSCPPPAPTETASHVCPSTITSVSLAPKLGLYYYFFPIVMIRTTSVWPLYKETLSVLPSIPYKYMSASALFQNEEIQSVWLSSSKYQNICFSPPCSLEALPVRRSFGAQQTRKKTIVICVQINVDSCHSYVLNDERLICFWKLKKDFSCSFVLAFLVDGYKSHVLSFFCSLFLEQSLCNLSRATQHQNLSTITEWRNPLP